eukprot:TRINITY_DN3285_c0_g1_i23.p1 TRINITY_DN3285_c0_g1~~TRINITY_DN3285_c0_g1_i23.p1  ORF type:complete len:226 (+),score=42.48 TRINITY_DN3285_c0_g1_i23:125-802(+)
MLINRTTNLKLSGSFYYTSTSSKTSTQFVGMDYSTMTPFLALAGTISVPSGAFMLSFPCVRGAWGTEQSESMKGYVTIRGTWEKLDIMGDCTNEKKVQWIFSAVGIKSESYYYPPKEAGMRAKYLIGQSSERYKAAHVVMYAIFDYPYKNVNCSYFLESQFPVAPSPEPGAIIVGSDGRHCGILDDEGTKFTHSNPVTKKVTYDSIAVISRYFPHGVVYKKYHNK